MLKKYITPLSIAFSVAVTCNADEKFSLMPDLIKTVSIKSHDNTKHIELFGIPYSDYSRALVKFNLDSIDYKKFGRVKKAILSFSVVKNNNPGNLPCEISMIKTYWNSKASWSNPTGESKWPSKRRYSNIDYCFAADSTLTAFQFIARYFLTRCSFQIWRFKRKLDSFFYNYSIYTTSISIRRIVGQRFFNQLV